MLVLNVSHTRNPSYLFGGYKRSSVCLLILLINPSLVALFANMSTRYITFLMFKCDVESIEQSWSARHRCPWTLSGSCYPSATLKFPENMPWVHSEQSSQARSWTPNACASFWKIAFLRHLCAFSTVKQASRTV